MVMLTPEMQAIKSALILTLIFWSALSVAHHLTGATAGESALDVFLQWLVLLPAFAIPVYFLLGIFYKVLTDSWISIKNPQIITVTLWPHTIWMLMCLVLGPLGIKMPL